jgi:hypothetical protein
MLEVAIVFNLMVKYNAQNFLVKQFFGKKVSNRWWLVRGEQPESRLWPESRSEPEGALSRKRKGQPLSQDGWPFLMSCACSRSA